MPRARRIALVTCNPRPGLPADPELPGLLSALTAAGARATAVAWDDPDVDWAAFDLAAIRSTWDYAQRVPEFLDWAARCARLSRLANPEPVVRWNSDKRYLGDLARAGVPTVPTRYLPPGADGEPPVDGTPYVIKPSQGAGARLAARYEGTPADAERAREHLALLHAEGLTAMVQPYLRGIETTGERALVFAGGRFLHAIRKGAVLTAGTAHDAARDPHPEVRGWRATQEERALAEAALAAVPFADALLYARVDVVDGEDGAPRLMELELIEPYLFLEHHPESFTELAAVLLAAAGPVA
ncbi:RimK family alpha-L-glutamate ligase [Streptomyces sp. NPDC059816]|uniref:ATP-grasp domain-containing protein n=1 Tax=Streptomyces sp. NPDC059816 TaxID=3346960 RepID=UPI0036691C63